MLPAWSLWRSRYSPDGEHAYCPKCEQERVFRATRPRRVAIMDLHWLRRITSTRQPGRSSTSPPRRCTCGSTRCILITSTRCGMSAKQLEREIGVTYKTAWRMLNKIRNDRMADDGEPLSGDVEVDEASVDGKPRKPQGQHRRPRSARPRRSEAAKLRERSRATVFAAVERGGRIKATVLPSRHGPQLKQQVIEWVEPESIIVTDEWPAYNGLDQHFIAHSRINHSAGWYVEGDTHTNTDRGLLRAPQAGDPGHLPARCPTAGYRATSTSSCGAERAPTRPTRCSSSYLVEPLAFSCGRSNYRRKRPRHPGVRAWLDRGPASSPSSPRSPLRRPSWGPGSRSARPSWVSSAG